MSLPVRRVLAGALVAGLAVLIAPAPTATAGALGPVSALGAQGGPWAGTWITTYDIELTNWVQNGNHVTGNWIGDPVWGSGPMEGTVTGNVLRGRWTQSNPEFAAIPGGPLELTLSAGGTSFSGWWSADNWGDGAQFDITAHRSGGGGGNPDPCSVRAFSPPGVPRPAARDCTPPKVRALPFKGFTRPGERITLGFSVKDGSGRANARITLFEGGQSIRNASYSGKATGRKLIWRVNLPAGLEGPLFFCIWAKDAAGNKSAGAPRSSCAWIKMVVPIESVSNGCGGEGWDAVVAAENYFGNTSTYYGEDRTPYEVSFVDACNVHDAGYGGHTVYDRFTGVKIDFHGWSRGEVDEKFRMDMEKLCEEQIPEEEQQARAECKANLHYPTVRTVGGLFFDADPMHVGTQSEGTRSND